METNELLNKAREAFIKSYEKTPESAGFSVVRCWNNEVVFAQNEQVFTALQKSQTLIKTGLNIFFVIFAMWAIGLTLYLIAVDNPSISKFPFWTILLSLFAFFIICTGIQLKCNKWENIYLKEGCHLIYNGKRFYAIKDDTPNSNTTFF